MGLYFTSSEGEKKPVFLGSYGVGVTRLVGVLTEIFSDEKGIVWPREVAPFAVHLIGLGEDMTEAENLYKELNNSGVETLFDGLHVHFYHGSQTRLEVLLHGKKVE
jgi:prolyl-tRNA synthetase